MLRPGGGVRHKIIVLSQYVDPKAGPSSAIFNHLLADLTIRFASIKIISLIANSEHEMVPDRSLTRLFSKPVLG